MKYKRLFTPIVLANQEIKNRIVMAPMGTGFESQYDGGRVTTEMIDYYEARAKGGVGLIVSPFAGVDERYFALTFGVYSRKLLPGISRLVEALHVFGCKFLVQLAHFGGKSPKGFMDGRELIAPSSIESRMYPDVPKEMTLAQIEETINLFLRSGEWVREVGCDGVELHGAHGYLIGQFVSPHSNKRTDEYGGTLEKRMNFLIKIARGIREKCGDNFIIGYKFSAHEHLEGGIDLGLAQRIAQYINKQEIIDYVHVSAFSSTLTGFLDCDYPSVPPIYNPHPLVPLAEKIKEKINIPVMAAGGISDPDYAETILAEGKADMVALGRSLIADPDWPNKAKNRGNIKYCIKCNICYKRVLNQQSIKCSVNPYVGEERRYENYRVGRAQTSKKVVIIGSGPAGMEAALVASRRGHNVILLEKRDKIGGKLRLASIPDFKFEARKLLNYYESEIRESNIDLRMGVETTPEYVAEEKADVVIIAIGSDSIVPSIPGIDKEGILMATEVLEKEQLNIGPETIIVGAGLVGCELSLYLSLKGVKVKVVDCIGWDEILNDEHPTNRSMLLRRMEKEGVVILPNSKVVKISDEGVIVKDKNNENEALFADTIIIAAGFKPQTGLSKEYEDKVLSLASNLAVYSIGDCVKCENLCNAINSGAQVAWQI